MSGRETFPLNRQIKKILLLKWAAGVGKEKKYMNENSLINLATKMEANYGDITEDELIMLMNMFYEKYGTAMNGMALNPRFLIQHSIKDICFKEERHTTKKETLAVRIWQEQEDIDLIEGIEYPDKSIDMDFMCERPQDCSSHKGYGCNCKCIRANFENPTQYNKWVDKQINELGTELKDLLPSKK